MAGRWGGMIPHSEHVLMFCSCIAEHLGNGYGNAFDGCTLSPSLEGVLVAIYRRLRLPSCLEHLMFMFIQTNLKNGDYNRMEQPVSFVFYELLGMHRCNTRDVTK